MLKITGPIELKTRRPFVGSFDGFYERIAGNYSVIGSKLSPEDLLHLVTAPPEIFIEEGGNVNILNQNSVFGGQSEKIDIINNLMNRIVVDADYGLTYQDRVFITDVLSKLGVTDVKSFMQKVANLEYDTIVTQKLTNDYFTELSNRMTRIENLPLSESERAEEAEPEQEKLKAAFYRSMMDRLHTAAIYQIIRNFSDTTENNTISVSLTRNAEQNYLTKQVLLNTLREDVSGERLPLTFRNEEYLQETEGDTEEITEQNVTKALSSEILFNMVKNLYHATFDRTEYREGKSFDFSRNFYRLGDNVLSRITYRADGSRFEDYYDFIESAGDEFENAVTIFSSMAENNEERTEYLENLRQTIESFAGDTYESRVKTESIDGSISEETAVLNETNVRVEEASEELTELTENISEETVNTEALERELREINERNVRNHERYREIFTSLKQKAARDSRDGRTLTKQEALKALSDRNYRPDRPAGEAALPREQDEMLEAVRQTLMEMPDNEINVFELMEQYDRSGREGPTEAGSIKAVQSLMSDIKRVETVFLEEPDVEGTAAKAGAEAAKKIAERSLSEQGAAASRRIQTEEITPVSFVHKTDNTLSEEEIRESLEELRRSVKQETTDKEIESTTVISNEKRKELRIEEVGEGYRKQAPKTEAEIEAMISRGVKSQMSRISEQVMSKLAKKLSQDRARRGL